MELFETHWDKKSSRAIKSDKRDNDQNDHSNRENHMAGKPTTAQIALGRRVAELRNDRKLTQVELADIIGEHYGVVYRIEHATVQLINIDTLRRLADALRCSVNDLMQSPGSPIPIDRGNGRPKRRIRRRTPNKSKTQTDDPVHRDDSSSSEEGPTSRAA